jgi:hypothetical protein
MLFVKFSCIMHLSQNQMDTNFQHTTEIGRNFLILVCVHHMTANQFALDQSVKYYWIEF